MNTVDPIAHLNDLRRRVLAGEEVSPAELSNALSLIRRDRASAPVKEKKEKAAATPINLEDLFKGV